MCWLSEWLVQHLKEVDFIYSAVLSFAIIPELPRNPQVKYPQLVMGWACFRHSVVLLAISAIIPELPRHLGGEIPSVGYGLGLL
jgi:hypothetical protein